MASTNDSISTCCVLSNHIHDGGGSVYHLRNILWETVWEFMSPKTRLVDSLVVEDYSWILAACSFTGCTETMRFLLHKFTRQQESDTTTPATTRQLLNRRTLCIFPIPDSWVHQHVRLALSPLHVACWRLDFHMIQILLRLGADPTALALEQVGDSSSHVSKSDIDGNKGVNRQNIDSSHKNDKPTDACDNSPMPPEVPYKSKQKAEKKDTAGFIDKDKHLSGTAHATPINPNESRNNSGAVTVDGEMFHPNTGLSPLDFVMLGLRSPPMHSMSLASNHGVIHDVQNTCSFTGANMTGCDNLESICRNPYCALCLSFLPSVEDGDNKPDNECFEDVKKVLLIKCIEVLIFSGANPNQSRSKFLGFRYPLDVLIQPVIEIYYEPMIGRSSQLAVNIRRYNLGTNISDVTSACRLMLSHNAHLSPSFIYFHKWKPQYLDCFAIVCSKHAIELVKIITRLGLFSDHSAVSITVNENSENQHKSDYNEKQDIALQKNLETFLSGVVNMQCPKELVLTVFQFFSICTIHLFCKIAIRVIESSEFDHVYLSDLIKSAMENQMRTLTHSSMLVILNSMDTTHNSIKALPIPSVLKRRLLFLEFQ